MSGFEVNTDKKQEVTVVDVKMPFISMVILMVKFAVASIPAFIILSFIFMILGSLFGGVFHSMMGFSNMR